MKRFSYNQDNNNSFMAPQATFYLQKRTCGASLCKPQGAEVLPISSDGDDRKGAKLKTQKNPWAKN